MNCHRIVSVDFFRGLAILGVVLTHCLIYGVFYSTANALATVPIGLLAVLSPIVLISPMAGLFAFISVTANPSQLCAVSKTVFGQKRHSTAIIDVDRPDCLSFRIFAFTEKFQCLDV